jgi:hypothetical protein
MRISNYQIRERMQLRQKYGVLSIVRDIRVQQTTTAPAQAIRVTEAVQLRHRRALQSVQCHILFQVWKTLRLG